MKSLAAALLFSCAVLCAQDQPKVSAPPDRFFDLVRDKHRERAREFYQKYIDVAGMPVVAAAQVDDRALQRTHWMVTHMLAGRPDLLEAMVKNGMYLIVIGKDQVYTDMPEYSDHPNPAYQNERVRGTGGKPTSFGEENLLSLPLDRYDDESIGVHEFCHTIDSTLRSIDPGWPARRDAVYREALENGLWKNSYAASNPGEFWAEVAQSYFDCNRVNNWNHGPIGTREQLKAYHPAAYELARGVFNLQPSQDWRYTWVQPLPNVTPPPPKFDFPAFYTKFTWAREFPVLGRAASDSALLQANDAIRKMFAYRHDLLKALINEGVRLVVLAKNEHLSELPETRDGDIDQLARYLEYTPDLKLIVVAEENITGHPAHPLVGDAQVVRLFAKAVYDLCAHRPVDPNWDKRGREVQQYELRVTRLDVRFKEKLDRLLAAARSQNLWKGVGSLHSPPEYWARGVLAYFDAAGQVHAPEGAAHPISTRESLRAYDPDLFKLVAETMAYEERVDWRYRSRIPGD